MEIISGQSLSTPSGFAPVNALAQSGDDPVVNVDPAFIRTSFSFAQEVALNTVTVPCHHRRSTDFMTISFFCTINSPNVIGSFTGFRISH